MTKTAFGVNGKRTKVELVVTAAMVTALASLTTAETIDISQIVKSISGGDLTRVVNKEYVTGDAAAILDYDTDKQYSDIVLVFLHTNGEEVMGTDTIDIGAVLDELADYIASNLSLQIIWSVAGGGSGDEERLSSATETFIVGLTQPVGGVDTAGKVQRTLTLSTSAVTKATVS